MNNHSLQNTEEEPIAFETTPAAHAAHAAHTRYLSSPAATTLHGKTRFRAPAFSPTQAPCNNPWSHYTAICNQRCNKRIESRTHEQPLDAEHRGGTDRDRNDPSRTRRTHELPFIAGCSHFTRKNTRFRARAFSQKEAHATSTQPLRCDQQPESKLTHHPSWCIVSHFSL